MKLTVAILDSCYSNKPFKHWACFTLLLLGSQNKKFAKDSVV